MDVRLVAIPHLRILSIGNGGVECVMEPVLPWGRSSRLACLVARLPGGVDVGLRDVAIRKIRRR